LDPPARAAERRDVAGPRPRLPLLGLPRRSGPRPCPLLLVSAASPVAGLAYCLLARLCWAAPFARRPFYRCCLHLLPACSILGCSRLPILGRRWAPLCSGCSLAPRCGCCRFARVDALLPLVVVIVAMLRWRSPTSIQVLHGFANTARLQGW